MKLWSFELRNYHECVENSQDVLNKYEDILVLKDNNSKQLREFLGEHSHNELIERTRNINHDDSITQLQQWISVATRNRCDWMDTAVLVAAS